MREYTSREMPSRFLGPGFFGGGLDVVAGEGAGTERIDLISDMDAPDMMGSCIEGGGRREEIGWRVATGTKWDGGREQVPTRAKALIDTVWQFPRRVCLVSSCSNAA